MAKEPEPEMFEGGVSYERFILPETFRKVKRLIHPTHGESVEPIMWAVEVPDKPKREVVSGVKLRMSTSKRLYDAEQMFKREAKWK